MKLPSLYTPYLLTSINLLAPSSSMPEKTNDTMDLLHRTMTIEEADPSYWTDYDHFMVEREAQALRRAYVYGLIARAWKRLWQRLPGRGTAASDAPYIGL